MFLQFFLSPLAKSEIEKREQNGRRLIDQLRTPCHGRGGAQFENHQPDKDDIEKKIDKLNRNCRFDRTRSRHRVEKHKGDDLK